MKHEEAVSFVRSIAQTSGFFVASPGSQRDKEDAQLLYVAAMSDWALVLREALEEFVQVCDTAPPVEFINRIGMVCDKARAALSQEPKP